MEQRSRHWLNIQEFEHSTDGRILIIKIFARDIMFQGRSITLGMIRCSSSDPQSFAVKLQNSSSEEEILQT